VEKKNYAKFIDDFKRYNEHLAQENEHLSIFKHYTGDRDGIEFTKL
jgi:hypothetical protein